MTTSGRSESIHSFFDGFVNSKTMLNEFVIQFDKAVDTRRAAEEDEDFQTINSTPVLSSVHPIEAKAGMLCLSSASILFTNYHMHEILDIIFLQVHVILKIFSRYFRRSG